MPSSTSRATERHALRAPGLQRLWLRGALAAGAAFGRPLVVDGLAMDRKTSVFVRFANRARPDGPVDLGEFRRRYAAAPSLIGLHPDRTVTVTAVTAGTRPARRYAPVGRPVADLLYFHGGGFISGSLDTHDGLCRWLAARCRLRVTAVDYRLAPEHPFPAAHDDAAAAWAWAQTQDELPWLLGGDSAGANLAAVQALDGRAKLQLLLYPPVDLLHQDGLYPSIATFQDGFLLDAQAMRACADMLIPPEQDPADPRLSPIRADLSAASPALVVTAGFDPLRDQGRAYARALEMAGVRAHLLEESALPHGFADFAGVIPAARRALDRIADAVRAELG